MVVQKRVRLWLDIVIDSRTVVEGRVLLDTYAGWMLVCEIGEFRGMDCLPLRVLPHLHHFPPLYKT